MPEVVKTALAAEREGLLKQWYADVVRDPSSKRYIDEEYKARVTQFNLRAQETKAAELIDYLKAKESNVRRIEEFARTHRQERMQEPSISMEIY